MKKKSNPIKECLQYNISVEGENCELLYFEHLKKLINECEKAKYKVNFFIRAKTPSSFAKSRISIYTQKGKKSEGYVKFFHVQDIEDYYDKEQLNKFKLIIDDIEKTKKECNISSYDLAYSNYTFDLWMILHKYDLKTPVSNRFEYCTYINKGYKTKYTKIDEYKAVAEFTKILSSITLDDVITAIKRGHVIHNNHINNKDHIETYKKFNFYRDNPDMTIHIIIEKILEECKII